MPKKNFGDLRSKRPELTWTSGESGSGLAPGSALPSSGPPSRLEHGLEGLGLPWFVLDRKLSPVFFRLFRVWVKIIHWFCNYSAREKQMDSELDFTKNIHFVSEKVGTGRI